MAITITTGTHASVSTTEFFLFSNSTTVTYQTTDCLMQAFISVASMAAGDQYRINVYEKVNGGTALTVYSATLTGVQQGAFVTPALIVGEGYEVSVTKLTGTSRTVNWSLRTSA